MVLAQSLNNAGCEPVKNFRVDFATVHSAVSVPTEEIDQPVVNIDCRCIWAIFSRRVEYRTVSKVVVCGFNILHYGSVV